MFGICNKTTITEDLLNSYQSWDNYISHIWYLLLNYCEINNNSIIVELAPGISTKIAQALAKCYFTGKLFVIEPCASAREILQRKYYTLLPKADITIIDAEFTNNILEIPAKPDFLLASHIIDDLLICSAKEHVSYDDLYPWFNKDNLWVKTIGKDTNVFKNIWENLYQNKEDLNQKIQLIIKDLSNYFLKQQPKNIIFSQYSSLVLKENGMAKLNNISQNILQQLKEIHGYNNTEILQQLLNANKNYNNELIAIDVLNAKNWLLHTNV